MFFLQLSDIIDSWVQSHITVIEKKIIVFQQNYKKLSKNYLLVQITLIKTLHMRFQPQAKIIKTYILTLAILFGFVNITFAVFSLLFCKKNLYITTKKRH